MRRRISSRFRPEVMMRALLLLLPLLWACPKPEEVPEPGPLQAGVARVRMPVPLGIGTVGYGGFGGGGGGGGSPYAEIYPATQRIHGHPEFKAVAISRGPGFELVFLRADTVGIFQQFRRAVVLESERRLGRPMDDVIIMGGTHTHSGPGRVIDGGGLYDLIADRFFPEFYANMVNAAADAVEQAYLDLAPARVGHVWADAPDGHNDRRCEDGLTYTNDDLPLIAIEREGQVDAVVFAYPVHGTVLGIDDLTLSQDVSGAIEQQIEDRFDHPVEALFFNAWGADMAPTSPEADGAGGAELPGGFQRMEAIGAAVADAVEGVLPDLAWNEAPEIQSHTHRFHLNRQVIGYGAGEFEYEWGGVYCSVRGTNECDGVRGTEIGGCVPFPEAYPAPMQTELTAGRLGDLWWITFPGEPGTLLAEDLIARIGDEHGISEVMFLGYTQDYLGYSILEDDWWFGGYEASGALWGPKQGEYLRDKAAETFAVVASPEAPALADGPPPVAPFALDGFTPWEPTFAVRPGEIEVQPEASYGPADVITVTVRGSDPWLGAPIAYLERASGEPVTRANGAPVDSDDYTMWVDLVVEPAWSEPATERSFLWKYSFPTRRNVAGGVNLDGSYQLRVEVPVIDGSVAELRSSVFVVANE